MKKLDMGRPFGKISPPMEVDGTDMLANYEQDGVLFDAHGYPCVKGAKDAIEAAAKADSPAISASPVAAPAAEQTPRQKRAAARAKQAAAPASPDPVRAAPPPVNGVVDGVDLAAWGRGKQDYLFGEIRKAVKKAYGAQLTERRDVVDLLIEQRVITAAEARSDVV